MKIPEEIEQLAESYLQKNKYNFDNWKEIVHVKQTYIASYTQCQKDMANKIQSLIDGYNSKIDELYKHYKCGSSLLTLEQINTFEYLIVSNVIPNLEKLINKQD